MPVDRLEYLQGSGFLEAKDQEERFFRRTKDKRAIEASWIQGVDLVFWFGRPILMLGSFWLGPFGSVSYIHGVGLDQTPFI